MALKTRIGWHILHFLVFYLVFILFRLEDILHEHHFSKFEWMLFQFWMYVKYFPHFKEPDLMIAFQFNNEISIIFLVKKSRGYQLLSIFLFHFWWKVYRSMNEFFLRIFLWKNMRLMSTMLTYWGRPFIWFKKVLTLWYFVISSVV